MEPGNDGTKAPPDIVFRYPWHAALVFGVTAGVTAYLGLMIPLWMLMEMTAPVWTKEGAMAAPNAFTAQAFMIAMLTVLAAGAVAFVLWWLLLVPRRSFTFAWGAIVGGLIGFLMTLGFVIACAEPLTQFWFVWNEVPMPGDRIALGLMFSVPTTVLGAGVGGLLGAAQGRVLRAEDSEMRHGFDAPG